MKRWMKVTVGMLTLLSVTQVTVAQRGAMRMGGGGGVRSVGAAPAGGHVGVTVGSGSVSRGFVPFGSGFGERGGSRFRGTVGFGHNPRFHVGFGSGFRNRCFGGGFCGGFAGSPFFNSGIPIVGYYPYYPYYGDYEQSYSDYQQTSPYTSGQNESGYTSVYEQGAMAQQVKDLSGEVERLRAELDARESESARAAAQANPKASVQELPLNATLVLRNGRKMQIHNYAVVGQTIWLLDEKAASKIPVAQVDLAATKRANDANGVLFLLPGMK
ncbi:MAG: hypothetical protein JWO13_189 [Acidobacteriales bacterium]|nr:hypothetical protein [Terriglobales bacterium]